MKMAIFGGSFDPIHFGHLWAAQYAAEQLGLDEVIFLPAATSPLKPSGAAATGQQRLRMLQLALEGASELPLAGGGPQPANGRCCRLTIDDRELRRGGVSYTIDTVRELQQERGQHDWFLMIGSDAFAAIDRWHCAGELLDQITPLVYRRGDDPPIPWRILEQLVTPDRSEVIRAASVTLPRIEISSSDIRERVTTGRSIRFQVPTAVADFVRDCRLYQVAVSPS